MPACLPYVGAATVVDLDGETIAECPDAETARWVADVIANAERLVAASNEFARERALWSLREAVEQRRQPAR